MLLYVAMPMTATIATNAMIKGTGPSLTVFFLGALAPDERAACPSLERDVAPEAVVLLRVAI